MTIYISQGRYTATAIRAMTAKPENRSEAIAEMLAAAGGRLIGWYLTLGRYDWLIIAEAPDERTLVSAWRKPVRHNYDRGTLGRGYSEGFRPGG